MKIFHDPKLKKIDYLDERFYTNDGIKYFPSVTTILEVYPKGYGFNEWLKKLGFNADEELKKAGEEGTKIHDSIERYLKGEELTWVDENGHENYTLGQWKMLLKFVEFQTTYNPEILALESSLLDEELGFGGTIDMVCRINGEIYLIDYKSSNYIWKTHELQLSAYVALWNRFNPELKIRHHRILHLKALTRGEGKGGTIQGKGWQLKEFERPWRDAYKTFEHTKAIWTEENPNYVPKNETYPDRLKIKSQGSVSPKSSGEVKFEIVTESKGGPIVEEKK